MTTDHGYGAVTLAVQRSARAPARSAARSTCHSTRDDDEIVARFTSAVRPGRTRLAIVDQVTSPTAKLLPVARIAAGLRQLGVPLLVDAAHAPGMLPVDVAAIGADYWLGNLHKWAFAPRPTALLVVRRQHCARHRAAGGLVGAAPRLPDLGRVRRHPRLHDLAGRAHRPAPAAHPGTRPGPPAQHRAGGLRPTGRRGRGAGRSDRTGALRAGEHAARSAARKPVLQPERGRAVRERLAAQYKIEVSTNFWNGRGYLRLCAQVYNTETDLDRLADAVGELVAQSRQRPAA